MAARTNPFQNLIARIYESKGEADAKVTESAFVSEQGVITKAEIDIVITKRTHGVELRIAVECRDRGRPEGVEWIRELADKQESMRFNKVIAVSTSGFTSTARDKAADRGVELLTLEEAESLDFGDVVQLIGLCVVEW